jgi:hypothetical protein
VPPGVVAPGVVVEGEVAANARAVTPTAAPTVAPRQIPTVTMRRCRRQPAVGAGGSVAVTSKLLLSPALSMPGPP